jgi:hypothetical protein
MRKVRVVLLLSVLTLSFHAKANGEELPKLAVMPMIALKGLNKDAAALLTDLMATKVAALNRYEVVSSSAIEATLGIEKMKDAAGCSDVMCAAEIVGALGSDFMLSAKGGVLGTNLSLTLVLVDLQQMKEVRRASRSVKNDEDLYEGALTLALGDLFGIKPDSAHQGNSATDEKKCDLQRITKDEIAQVVKESLPQALKTCLADAKSRGEIQGPFTIELSFVVKNNGTLRDRWVGPKEIEKTGFSTCIKNHMNGWRFPTFCEGGPQPVAGIKIPIQ